MSEEKRDPIDWGYVRGSTEKQKSTLISQRDELIDKGVKQEHIFVDDATTGKTNMTKHGTAWEELQGKLQKGDRLVVHSHTRLGRKNHEIIYAVGNLIDRGISVWDLKSDKVYDDLDNFEQVLNLNMNSAFGDKERVEISSRTKTGLKTRTKAGFKLGQKKKLSRSHIAYIHTLREEGHGLKYIAGAVKVYSKKYGKEMPISPTTVQKVLSGNYGMTVEDWQATNDKAREDMYKVADAMRRIKQIDREATDA
jgi:DNA invertase Pin-like site-specific DNA recombinase